MIGFRTSGSPSRRTVTGLSDGAFVADPLPAGFKLEQADKVSAIAIKSVALLDMVHLYPISAVIVSSLGFAQKLLLAVGAGFMPARLSESSALQTATCGRRAGVKPAPTE